MSNQPHITREDIEHRFGYHRATFPTDYARAQEEGVPLHVLRGQLDADGNEATAPLHAHVRQIFMATATNLVAATPPGREQALMLTALQEASMWANAAVAMQSPLVRE